MILLSTNLDNLTEEDFKSKRIRQGSWYNIRWDQQAFSMRY